MRDPMSENLFDPELVARTENGAIQVDLPVGKPLMVVLAGPIKAWWEPGAWGSPTHNTYVQVRDLVREMLVSQGILAYCPYRAWQGAWFEGAQQVNDLAITTANVLIELHVEGVVADGTDEEVAVARRHGVPVVRFEADGTAAVAQLLTQVRLAAGQF